MGEFVFQMGGFIFKWRGHPMGGIGFDGGFSKVIGWGDMPPPPLWETLPQVTQFLEAPT